PHADGARLPIKPPISACSGDPLRHLALEGVGIACLSDIMTREDQREGRKDSLMREAKSGYRQPNHAENYRKSQLAMRK
ncbi:LysR family transcriptional regulator, partial [Pseudomonas syringae pv. tagetis]